ncbi:uncharacterized protein PRCAT00004665001 [Priceomyces carsonii]|uniref:uncharacterized protein n=1 Tax=Priceomyces carsonii TaxID=28549 RepID=UPI002EDB37DC|nr:unnamed protein product [Priceomyces carsonii]
MESPLSITLGERMSAYLVSSEDYLKQRKRTNKRLLKLRHELNLITKDTKNYKQKEKISKTGVEDYNKDERVGLLLLLTAERDILYALELKSLMEIGSHRASSYKTLMISRIKRALMTSKKLLEISKEEKDDIKLLELFTYTSLIQGFLSINKKKWPIATNAFSISKCALDFLLSRLDESPEENEIDSIQYRKTFLNEIADTIVDPSLSLVISQDESLHENTVDLRSISRKHCHENLLPYLHPAVKIIQKIDPRFVSEISSSVDLLKSIEWRGHEALLYNDEISFKIMKLTDENKNPWKSFKDANQFDSLLAGWREVLDLHTTDLEKSRDDDDLEKVQDRAILLTYINYNLLFTRLKRDMLIIDQLNDSTNISKRQDIARLYGTIIETIEEIKDLPGVYNDGDLYESLERLSLYFAAKKHINLADSFILNKKFPEALKIFKYIFDIHSQLGDNYFKIKKFPYDVATNDGYSKFQRELTKLITQAQISAQFAKDSSSIFSSYAIENLHKYPSSDFNSLVRLREESNIEPILCKPVLFDVAFNYIGYDFDSSSSRAASDPSPADIDSSKGKKRGFLGLFGQN